MSETELWRRMAEHLPPGRLEIWADSIVLAQLGGRTVREAIAAGTDYVTIWRAVWEMLELPASYR
ncbi:MULTISPECIES: DUF3046 domain-containing protein [unclassified Luteococcus]|uniref:DUF3046 domain-containing protein n=1 Tax=unclassified Luteococcus TaxID=2639923 RepID=UPI00313B66F8